MSSIFDRYCKKYDAWYDRNRFAYLSELGAIKKVLPKKGKGLEIGVGTGRFASALGITMGIDPSKNMIEIARQRGVIIHRGFGEDLPFWDSSFDYAAIIITLCFTKDPLKVLQEARRVLKKNGKIIMVDYPKGSIAEDLYHEEEYYIPEKMVLFFKLVGFRKVQIKLGADKNLMFVQGENIYE